MHKRNFTLKSGACLNDDAYSILSFDVMVEGDDVLLLLPEAEELDSVIGTSKWMVRHATAALVDGGVEIVGPEEGGCGGMDKKLDW